MQIAARRPLQAEGKASAKALRQKSACYISATRSPVWQKQSGEKSGNKRGQRSNRTHTTIVLSAIVISLAFPGGKKGIHWIILRRDMTGEIHSMPDIKKYYGENAGKKR